MVRGKTLSAIVLLGVLASCDENSTAPSSYPPPIAQGTGTIFEFQARNSYGTDVFHTALTQFLSQHPEYRLVSIFESEHESSNNVVYPTKYFVVFEMIGSAPPPPQPTPPDLSTLKPEKS
jgi:hypothetical protein